MKKHNIFCLAVMLSILVILPQSAKANPMQYNLINAGMNLGWAVTAIELGGITPASEPVIADYITKAIGFISEANSMLWGPYTTLNFSNINSDLERFWTHTARLKMGHRASFIANVYNRLRQRISYIYYSRQGLQLSPNCDSNFLEVGYHFGRANMAAFLGNESYRASAHSSMINAINNGLISANRLGCGFGTKAEWDTLPFSSPYTSDVYTAVLPPLLDIALNAFGIAGEPFVPSDPEGSTPPPPSPASLTGIWRFESGTVVEFRASGRVIAGYVVQPSDMHRILGFKQGEMIYELTETSGNKYSGRSKIRYSDGRSEWGKTTITVNGNSASIEDIVPNGTRLSARATRVR